MKEPTVTVITPVYNRGDLLKLTMQSVLDQSFNDFEYIIIDDCSTENIKSIVDNFNDNRLIFLRHDVNKMLSESYNTGLGATKGTYIALVESDDIWHRDKLKKQIVIMEKDKEIGAVYCGMVVKDINGNVLRNRIPRVRGHVFKDIMEKSVISSLSTLLIRKSALEKAGHFNKKFDPASSYEFELRLSKFTNFDFVPDIEVDYLQHKSNLSNELDQNISMQTKFHQNILNDYGNDFKTYPDQYIKKLSSLGMNYIVLGNNKKAREYFKMALDVDKNNFKNWRNFLLSFFPAASSVVRLRRFLFI